VRFFLFLGGEGILRGLKPGLLRVCNHQGSLCLSKIRNDLN
jgi:hypothetical protein